MHLRAFLLSAAMALSAGLTAQQTPHTLTYAPGKSITLTLPDAFDIHIAASGLPRIRFFAPSPDGRIFATTLYDLGDNSRGSIVILDGFNPQTHHYDRVTPYLQHLRNPNSIAFFTDPATSRTWLYIALTDKLIRYPLKPGDMAPSAPAQILMRFPDYGLHYKYGGWHLTRTLQFAPVHGKPRLFVSVGSSCNYCQEHEAARASILVMDPDGTHASILAHGVRNAVGLGYFPQADPHSLYATNMGDDHLGDELPDDTLLAIPLAPPAPLNYGWPTCYFANGKVAHDATLLPTLHQLASAGRIGPAPEGGSIYGVQSGVASAGTNLAAGGGHTPLTDPNAALGNAPAPLTNCAPVPPPWLTFAAHSSPLGIQFFPDPALKNSFLVALHGAGHPRIGSGYRVVRFTAASDRTPQDFLTGFLTRTLGKVTVHGRPCGILRLAPDTFLVSDDYLGLVYYVHPRT